MSKLSTWKAYGGVITLIGSRTQAHSWKDAGYKTESVQLGKQVVFIKE
ncbi:hypothetical protein [Psychrobacillus sp. MER TA 171]|nr:hypothetical protein [Psychrobacillus sp. MER TA 171]MCM3359233.1 hypothetical protein [Psychrobacillus sp. MER TA 171]